MPNLTLFVSDHIPQNLWYNFERLNLDILKDSKRGYEMDDESPSHNQIFVIRKPSMMVSIQSVVLVIQRSHSVSLRFLMSCLMMSQMLSCHLRHLQDPNKVELPN